MTTNSLQLSDFQIDRVIRQVLIMFDEQMRRELEAEVLVIVPQSMQYLGFCKKIETLTNGFSSFKCLNMYPAYILRALDSSLTVQISSLSHQSHITRIDLSFSPIALSDTLEASLSYIRHSPRLPEIPDWFTELFNHESTLQLQLKWALQDEEIIAELISAKADSDDWLAKLLVSESVKLTQAVNRAFKVETMIQTRRLYNAA